MDGCDVVLSSCLAKAGWPTRDTKRKEQAQVGKAGWNIVSQEDRIAGLLLFSACCFCDAYHASLSKVRVVVQPRLKLLLVFSLELGKWTVSIAASPSVPMTASPCVVGAVQWPSGIIIVDSLLPAGELRLEVEARGVARATCGGACLRGFSPA